MGHWLVWLMPLFLICFLFFIFPIKKKKKKNSSLMVVYIVSYIF